MGFLKTFDDLPVVSGSPWPGIQYFSTTRAGGVSVGSWGSLNLGLHTGDSAAAVHANRQRLGQSLPGAPLWLEQVHGTTIHDADDDHISSSVPASGGQSVPRADASISASPECVLCIMTADCLPVVIGSADGTVLGVAHAGWRGLAAGILEETVTALQRRDGRVSATWRAWIGPGISKAHFEVGSDVQDVFVRSDPECERFFAPSSTQGKWLADLPSIAAHRLWRAGVAHVEKSQLCTYARSDLFFSYRRQPVTGRIATLAWRRPQRP